MLAGNRIKQSATAAVLMRSYPGGLIMRITLASLTLVSLAMVCGCKSMQEGEEASPSQPAKQAVAHPIASDAPAVGERAQAFSAAAVGSAAGGGGGSAESHLLQVSNAELKKAAAEYAERKVIR